MTNRNNNSLHKKLFTEFLFGKTSRKLTLFKNTTDSYTVGEWVRTHENDKF